MNRSVKIVAIIVALLMVVFTSLGVGVLIGSTDYRLVAGSETNSEEPSQFKVFWQAWDTVEKNFVDRAALDPQTMTYGAIRGMVEALGDEGHTSFLTPQERERQSSELSGT